MALAAPDWLNKRGCTLKLGSDGKTWYVLLGEQPQYSLSPTPVGEKHGCVVKQTNNGRRLESAGAFASNEEAMQSGLNDLGKALGWV